jgi:hypothetical protein
MGVCVSHNRADADTSITTFLTLGTTAPLLLAVSCGCVPYSHLASAGPHYSGKTTFLKHLQLVYDNFETKDSRQALTLYIRTTVIAHLQTILQTVRDYQLLAPGALGAVRCAATFASMANHIDF